MSLANASHMDPCVVCRSLELRADMVRANTVSIKGRPVRSNARGYVCQFCLNNARLKNSK